MKLRILRYVVVGLVAFAIGLITFLPARIAAGWIDDATPLSVGGVTGTLFNGHAAYASGPGGAIEDLNWQLRPTELLLGRVGADIEIGSDLGGFSAHASRSLFGVTHIEDFTGSASAGWLAKLGGYTFLPLSADVHVDISEAKFDDQLTFSSLDGQLRLGNARWELFNPPVDLGQVTAALGQSKNGLRLAIVNSEGPLAIDGQLTLTPDRQYALDARLRARAGADDRLGNMLDQIGRADAEGWHRVRQQGRL